MNKNNKKQTAAQKVFAAYTKHISELVIKKYGPSYSTYTEIRNKWRYLIPYNEAIEAFLIFQTKMYIRFLDSRDPNSTNPDFLKALVRLMADYLSAYTKNNPGQNSRKKAKELLNIALYDKCSYIQNLLTRQMATREAKNISKRRTYKRPNPNKRKTNRTAETNKFMNRKNLATLQIVEITIKKR